MVLKGFEFMIIREQEFDELSYPSKLENIVFLDGWILHVIS
jgi:hypothetical protein